MDEQLDSAASHSEDKKYDNNLNEKHKKIESADINVSKHLLLKK